jgi:hypothetical protein
MLPNCQRVYQATTHHEPGEQALIAAAIVAFLVHSAATRKHLNEPRRFYEL